MQCLVVSDHHQMYTSFIILSHSCADAEALLWRRLCALAPGGDVAADPRCSPDYPYAEYEDVV